MGSWATCQQAHLLYTHRSKTARTQNTSQHASHPQSHHPRCPSRLGTGSQAHLHQHQQLLLLLYPPRQHHPLPLQQHLSIQVAAAQTLAAASRTARGAPASNPSSGTSGRSNFSAGSLRILNARLVVCSRRRPCCGGCTGSTSRAPGDERVAAAAMDLRGVTLLQLLVCWKCQHICAHNSIFQKERTAPFFSFFFSPSLFPRPLPG